MDFDVAVTNLEDFNALVTCDGNTEWDFTSVNCTGCNSILDTATLNVPSCVTDSATANLLFTNLKAYITEENAFVD